MHYFVMILIRIFNIVIPIFFIYISSFLAAPLSYSSIFVQVLPLSFSTLEWIALTIHLPADNGTAEYDRPGS
jgi:hypothetical protein